MNFHRRFSSLLLLAAFLTVSAAEARNVSPVPPALIPQPAQLAIDAEARPFYLSSHCTVYYTGGAAAEKCARLFAERLKETADWTLPVEAAVKAESADGILFRLAELPPDADQLDRESYQLTIEPNLVCVTAGDEAGLFYGLQTLLQLLPPRLAYGSFDGPRFDDNWEHRDLSRSLYSVPPALPETVALPKLTIDDRPRYPWRGSMADVARHYMPMEYLYQLIDLMAAHKLNTLQLHLVDDQAWRLEIKAFPQLVKEGSSGSYSGAPGGFYSQQELRELVAYAAERHITIVPEIDLPGHSTAVTRVMHLNCNPSSGVYCIGNPETFPFLEKVFDEVLEIFPSRYVHIGGDECPKDAWLNCPKCQALMKQENLASGEALQSYVTRHMNDYLQSKGRTLIGWDEILEGGLPPKAVVMSWRSQDGGVEAAKLGHYTVMSPTGYVYLDYRQSGNEPFGGALLPMSKTYQFQPTPPELTPEQQHYVLGGQGNLWAENLPTPAHAAYMLAPRIAAVAEAVWSPAEVRDWPDFARRMLTQLERYSAMKFPARQPRVFFEAAEEGVRLRSELPGASIRYTLNDEEPGWTSLQARDGQLIPWQDGKTLQARLTGNHGALFPVSSKKLYRPQIHFETNMTQPYGMDHGPEAAWDYDEATYFWSGEPQQDGQYLTAVLHTPKKLDNIRVATGDHGRDILHQGVLEVSADGRTFTKAADFVDGEAAANRIDQPVKAIRIRVTAPDEHWLIIKEIETTEAAK